MDRGYSGVGRSLLLSTKNNPDKPAIVEERGPRLSYRQLDTLANKLANYLTANGCEKGDHVGILSDNCAEHIVALYAAAKIAAVSISFDPRWRTLELAATQRYVNCKFLICDEVLLPKVSDAALSGANWQVIAFSRHTASAGLAEILASTSAEEPSAALSDHDVSTLMLTSGTTGLPKGCIRTNRVVECSFKDVQDGLDGLDDTVEELIVVPVYYGSGRARVMRQIYSGSTMHLMDTFEPDRTAAYITKHAISVIALAPTMCKRILSLGNLERFEFGSLRMLQKAGSPFSPEMAKELSRKISPNIYQAFATSETGTVTALRPRDQFLKLGSSGKISLGVELDIVAPDGTILPRGEAGEIKVRGPQVCEGYYNNPIEQNKAFRDGWYYTGDIGRIDEDGYLYVVGRKKDMIKTGSINVSPLEIEQTIQIMSEVQDVAIVGVPDPEWGEAVMAVVVSSSQTMTGKIIEHCRRSLASYKVPKYFQYVELIERNSQGKVTSRFKEALIERHLCKGK